MVGAPFYNANYGLNANCYDLCNIQQPVVYSEEAVVKRRSNHNIANTCMDIRAIGTNNRKNASKLTITLSD